jgi:hypothetical protein
MIFFFQHDVKLNEKKTSWRGIDHSRNVVNLSMKNGKSPGSDGFTVDFYKFFWKDIGAFVFLVIIFWL